MQIDELLDLEHYPLDRPGSDGWNELVEVCRAMHEEGGCANLPGFIRPDALPALVHEAQGLLANGYRKSHLRTALFNHGDPNRPQGHPARRIFRENSLQVASDQIGTTLIRRIYEWQPLTDFVAAVEGCEVLYRMADAYQALNLIAHENGNGLPWHFDVNDMTVTLLLQASEAGGEFVFVPDMRNHEETFFEPMARLFDGDTTMIHRTDRADGTLTLFHGHDALHAVTPVEGKTSRISAILTYDERPDCVSSERGHVMVYGPRVEAVQRRQAAREADR